MPSVTLRCPSCEQAFPVDFEKQGECPNCGRQLSDRWYVSSEWYRSSAQDNPEGPFTLEELKGLKASGRLRPTQLLLREGTQQSVPASSLSGLFPDVASVSQSAAAMQTFPSVPQSREPDAPRKRKEAPRFGRKRSWIVGVVFMTAVAAGSVIWIGSQFDSRRAYQHAAPSDEFPENGSAGLENGSDGVIAPPENNHTKPGDDAVDQHFQERIAKAEAAMQQGRHADAARQIEECRQEFSQHPNKVREAVQRLGKIAKSWIQKCDRDTADDLRRAKKCFRRGETAMSEEPCRYRIRRCCPPARECNRNLRRTADEPTTGGGRSLEALAGGQCRGARGWTGVVDCQIPATRGQGAGACV